MSTVKNDGIVLIENLYRLQPRVMPLYCRFDPADKFIEVSLSERVSVADLLIGLRDLIENREFEPDYDQLIDCSKTEIVGLSPKIMMAIRDITSSARGGRRALIVPSGPLPTMISFFLRLRGDNAKVRAFKSREEGFLWLGRDARSRTPEAGAAS